MFGIDKSVKATATIRVKNSHRKLSQGLATAPRGKQNMSKTICNHNLFCQIRLRLTKTPAGHEQFVNTNCFVTTPTPFNIEEVTSTFKNNMKQIL